MTELKIEVYGPGLNLYIGCMSPDQMVRLEKSCPRVFGYYWKRTLERIWYTNTRVMKKVFGVDHWTQMVEEGHHYRGPILKSPRDARQMLENASYSIDDESVDVNSRRIDLRMKGPRPFKPPENRQVVIFHGEHYTGYTNYLINLGAPFDPSLLVFEFSDCGDNGHVLSRVSYDGRTMAQTAEASEHGLLHLQFVVDEKLVAMKNGK
jgi:hypothetical protein